MNTGIPGPDGPSCSKATDSGTPNPVLDKGEDQMSADLGGVKKSIRVLF